MSFEEKLTESPLKQRLVNALNAKHPLVAVHRGSPGGCIVENTALAVRAALAEGADIVEIDLIQSTDGDFFVFHNGYEKLYFDLDRDIRTLSTKEIENLQYEDFIQSSVQKFSVEKLSTVLQSCPDALLNIDRSWAYWNDLLGFLDEFDCADRVLLKAPGDSPELEILANHPIKYGFMPIAKTMADLDRALAMPGLSVVAVEVLAEDAASPFAKAETLSQLKDHGILVFVNALNLANRKNLYLGWDDETSVLIGPESGWGRLITQGADIIQTDWPGLLNLYLESRAESVSE